MTIGHIIRAEFRHHPLPEAVEGDVKFGVWLTIEPEDAKKLPDDLLVPFIPWGSDRIREFVGACRGGEMRDLDDLKGMPVTFERDENGSAGRVMPALTEKWKHIPQDWEKKLSEYRDRIKHDRGRRFELCRALQNVRDVIEHLPATDQRKNELTNLTNVLLRMVIDAEGQEVSVQKLQAF